MRGGWSSPLTHPSLASNELLGPSRTIKEFPVEQDKFRSLTDCRLGQEPPKATEFAHDGLTLFEVSCNGP